VSVETLPTTSPERRGLSTKELLAGGLIAATLGLAYAPNFNFLSGIWRTDPNYSHGYLVIPIALMVLWLRQSSLDRSRVAPKWWGWVLLAGVFALRSYFYEANEIWLEDATIPLAVASLALAFGGWTLFVWSLPAIIFMGFMLPLPNRFNVMLAYPLQRLATIGSCDLLQMLGLPVLPEGNVIIIGMKRLEVARACNGLSMLLSFLTLITAAAILIPRPVFPDRVALLASAIPIALVINILRISTTGLCFYFYGTDEILLPLINYRLPHDWAGYLMMPAALVLMFLELRILSWLFVTDEPRAPEVATFGRGASTENRVVKKAPDPNGRVEGGGVED
jgi:exosortase